MNFEIGKTLNKANGTKILKKEDGEKRQSKQETLEQQEQKSQIEVNFPTSETEERLNNAMNYLALQNSIQFVSKRNEYILNHDGVSKFNIDGNKVIIYKRGDDIKSQIHSSDFVDINDIYGRIKDITPINPADDSTDSDGTNGVNGAIDTWVEQGGTGDCWLLVGVLAVNASAEGKQIIKDSITSNADGSVTVTFKGLNVSYTISAAEIRQHDTDENKSDAYSNGDNDMLALELATAKLLKDIKSGKVKLDISEDSYEAYTNEDYNLEGGFAQQMIYYLTGKMSDTRCADTDGMSETAAKRALAKGLDKNEIYEVLQDALDNPPAALAFGVYYSVKTATCTDGSKFTLDVSSGGHALAITNVTATTVTIINPWDSTEEYTMTWEEFANMGIGIISVTHLDKAENEDPEDPANPDNFADYQALQDYVNNELKNEVVEKLKETNQELTINDEEFAQLTQDLLEQHKTDYANLTKETVLLEFMDRLNEYMKTKEADDEPDNQNYAHGDVNGDGKVDKIDAQAILDVITGKETDKNVIARADIDADGDVDVEDILALEDIIIGINDNDNDDVIDKDVDVSGLEQWADEIDFSVIADKLDTNYAIGSFEEIFKDIDEIKTELSDYIKQNLKALGKDYNDDAVEKALNRIISQNSDLVFTLGEKPDNSLRRILANILTAIDNEVNTQWNFITSDYYRTDVISFSNEYNSPLLNGNLLFTNDYYLTEDEIELKQLMLKLASNYDPDYIRDGYESAIDNGNNTNNNSTDAIDSCKMLKDLKLMKDYEANLLKQKGFSDSEINSILDEAYNTVVEKYTLNNTNAIRRFSEESEIEIVSEFVNQVTELAGIDHATGEKITHTDKLTYTDKSTLNEFGFTNDEINKYFTEKTVGDSNSNGTVKWITKAYVLNAGITINGKEITNIKELIAALDKMDTVKNLINKVIDNVVGGNVNNRAALLAKGLEFYENYGDNLAHFKSNLKTELEKYISENKSEYYIPKQPKFTINGNINFIGQIAKSNYSTLQSRQR